MTMKTLQAEVYTVGNDAASLTNGRNISETTPPRCGRSFVAMAPSGCHMMSFQVKFKGCRWPE